ncbi:MAG TPA: hypothetical protein VND19_09005 [Acetobacteraceae bacterium]|nr:hypothetical protein [Acetobacteraceae bacterium]
MLAHRCPQAGEDSPHRPDADFSIVHPCYRKLALFQPDSFPLLGGNADAASFGHAHHNCFFTHI